MIAALPMYDRPELRGVHDRLWAHIRAHLLCSHLPGAPQDLTRDGDMWQIWQSPDLMLGQTCGLPYRTRLQDCVNLVGAPVWGLPCPDGYYFSVIIARADDPDAGGSAARLAVNDPLSQSGWAAAQGLTFGQVILTGGHAMSAQAVAENRADIAAIDAVTWALIDRYDPWAAKLRVIATTDPTPALPYITAQTPLPVFDALRAGIQALSPQDRAALCLRDVVQIPASDYLAVPNPPPCPG